MNNRDVRIWTQGSKRHSSSQTVVICVMAVCHELMQGIHVAKRALLCCSFSRIWTSLGNMFENCFTNSRPCRLWYSMPQQNDSIVGVCGIIAVLLLEQECLIGMNRAAAPARQFQQVVIGTFTVPFCIQVFYVYTSQWLRGRIKQENLRFEWRGRVVEFQQCFFIVGMKM